MTKSESRIRRKHFRLDSIKLLRAKKILQADIETETIERALDFVLSKYGRNLLAAETDEHSRVNGREIKDAQGGLGSDIAARFKKIGFVGEIPEFHGPIIWSASFAGHKKPRKS
jgi:hypothetical protein